MGQEISHIAISDIPDYFVETVSVDEKRILLLEKSLDSVIYGAKDKDRCTNRRLHFLKFYDSFFSKLDNLDKQNTLTGFQAMRKMDMETQTIFLGKLLKFVVGAPKQTLLSKKKGKWDKDERTKLKHFVSEHRDLSVAILQPLGLALIYAVEECDENCTSILKRYWLEAYSLLLQQIIPKSRLKLRTKKPNGGGSSPGSDLRRVILNKNLIARLTDTRHRSKSEHDISHRGSNPLFKQQPPPSIDIPVGVSEQYQVIFSEPNGFDTPTISPFMTPDLTPVQTPETSPENSPRSSRRSSKHGTPRERSRSPPKKRSKTDMFLPLWSKFGRKRAYTTPCPLPRVDESQMSPKTSNDEEDMKCSSSEDNMTYGVNLELLGTDLARELHRRTSMTDDPSPHPNSTDFNDADHRESLDLKNIKRHPPSPSMPLHRRNPHAPANGVIAHARHNSIHSQQNNRFSFSPHAQTSSSSSTSSTQISPVSPRRRGGQILVSPRRHKVISDLLKSPQGMFKKMEISLPQLKV